MLVKEIKLLLHRYHEKTYTYLFRNRNSVKAHEKTTAGAVRQWKTRA